MGNIEKQEYCLLDSALTHSIFTNKAYFSIVTLCTTQFRTISGLAKIIGGSRISIIVSPNGTTLHIEDALLFGRSKKNLLSCKDAR